MSSGAADNLFRYFLALKGDLRLVESWDTDVPGMWIFSSFFSALYLLLFKVITIKLLVCVQKMITKLREPRQRTHTLTTNENGPGLKTNPRSLFLCYLYQWFLKKSRLCIIRQHAGHYLLCHRWVSLFFFVIFSHSVVYDMSSPPLACISLQV